METSGPETGLLKEFIFTFMYMYIHIIITSASAFLFVMCDTHLHLLSNAGIKSSQDIRVVSLDALFFVFEMSRV